MPPSPVRARRPSADGNVARVSRTTGQRPACLVNASVTYCGDDQIYAFGGFDQYTDEVYNHVLKLDLASMQWTLVDNYGDIPGVRMGHTATLYQGDKLIIFGGENEHRTFLSDIVLFDLKTAHWTQPAVSGPIPKGRARHAAALYKDKLFIVGGVMGDNNSVLDDICYLDLTTWTWSRTWTFVRRFDHAAWIWGKKLWVFGGLGQDMDRGGEIWWLDLKSNPAFDAAPSVGAVPGPMEAGPAVAGPRAWGSPASTTTALGALAHPANMGGVHANASQAIRPPHAPTAPGITSVSFVSGPECPSQASGNHFYVYSSNALLDFVTPASTIRPTDCCLAALDLPGLRWQRLAEGAEIFNPLYRWHYCAMNEDGTQAWLLGCMTDIHGPDGSMEECLCDVLPIDLTRFGLLGNTLASARRSKALGEAGARPDGRAGFGGLGTDLAAMFDRRPEAGEGADFLVTAEADDFDHGPVDERGSRRSSPAADGVGDGAGSPPPIHVHRLILQARWPHFRRLYAARMAEFHRKEMHIPEPYSVVRAFLYYLYSDSIGRHPLYGDELGLRDVAGLLVMANVYDMPGLRLLCVNRLGRELDVGHAATIWERAGTANEDWLRRRAAHFCLRHWGRVVRTDAFKRLSRHALVDLCEEVDTEGRVVGGGELDVVAGLGGAGAGAGAGGSGGKLLGGWARAGARSRGTSAGLPPSDEMEDDVGSEDHEMDTT
ncbi:MAG: hypothetical protein M1826_000371 [Phylliscum demangeonii]|nr:MAG: hypothetical protein M1826_000371 [Phylliscum demangeonii]